jgi:hypothetical protein
VRREPQSPRPPALLRQPLARRGRAWASVAAAAAAVAVGVAAATLSPWTADAAESGDGSAAAAARKRRGARRASRKHPYEELHVLNVPTNSRFMKTGNENMLRQKDAGRGRLTDEEVKAVEDMENWLWLQVLTHGAGSSEEDWEPEDLYSFFLDSEEDEVEVNPAIGLEEPAYYSNYRDEFDLKYDVDPFTGLYVTFSWPDFDSGNFGDFSDAEELSYSENVLVDAMRDESGPDFLFDDPEEPDAAFDEEGSEHVLAVSKLTDAERPPHPWGADLIDSISIDHGLLLGDPEVPGPFFYSVGLSTSTALLGGWDFDVDWSTHGGTNLDVSIPPVSRFFEHGLSASYSQYEHPRYSYSAWGPIDGVSTFESTFRPGPMVSVAYSHDVLPSTSIGTSVAFNAADGRHDQEFRILHCFDEESENQIYVSYEPAIQEFEVKYMTSYWGQSFEFEADVDPIGLGMDLRFGTELESWDDSFTVWFHPGARTVSFNADIGMETETEVSVVGGANFITNKFKFGFAVDL